jgi:hypothetical protein
MNITSAVLMSIHAVSPELAVALASTLDGTAAAEGALSAKVPLANAPMATTAAKAGQPQRPQNDGIRSAMTVSSKNVLRPRSAKIGS